MIQKLQRKSLGAMQDAINRLIDEVNANTNFVGDGTVQVKRAGRATSISANINQITQRVAKVKPPGTRKAYCKVAAPAATAITCFLDVDTTGTEISVSCSIAGGGTLNEAVPRLTDGFLLIVKKVGGTWHSETAFQASEDCDCYEAP